MKDSQQGVAAAMDDEALDHEDAHAAAQVDAVAGHEDTEANPEQRERGHRKAQRRLDALTWTPPESTAVIWEELVIGHRTLQRGFNVWFVRAQIALHKLQQELPNVGSSEQVAGAAEVLEHQLQEIERDLRDEYARLQALAKNDGIEQFPPKSYSHPATLKVPVYAPGAGRVLRLIRRLDDLFWALDYLYISGGITVQHKVSLINRWKKQMWGLVHAQTKVWVRARDALNAGGRLTRRPRGAASTPAVAEVAGADAAGAVGAEGATEAAEATEATEAQSAAPKRARKQPARKSAPAEAAAVAS